ncbi:hypothetical protein MUK42_00091 [Musa troglodytarum]|uniref:Uncharacterized protein n=1 Tax=Musa troglodytarum TaxID=320322 RepID=A0A9E7FDI4_9LILI|nr:hypothetical protein MUK42_00091 [Musa troglodytarum]
MPMPSPPFSLSSADLSGGRREASRRRSVGAPSATKFRRLTPPHTAAGPLFPRSPLPPVLTAELILDLLLLMVFFFLALTLFLYLGVEFPRASPLPSPPPNRASILLIPERTKFGVALARSAVELQERQQSVRLASYWLEIERSGKTCTQDQRLTGCSAKDTEAAGLVGLISWRSPTLSSPLSEGNAAGKRRLIRECCPRDYFSDRGASCDDAKRDINIFLWWSSSDEQVERLLSGTNKGVDTGEESNLWCLIENEGRGD